MNTILEILIVTKKEGISGKTKLPYSITEAHCVIRDASGAPGAVGVMVVPKDLEGTCVPGTYSATFRLAAGTYGPDQGRIVAQIAGLSALSRPSKA